jgi:hypothetical protein
MGGDVGMVKLFIRDKSTGKVREYGTNRHDSLIVDPDGRIKYFNLQNGCGTGYGEYSEYEFVPDQDNEFIREVFPIDGTIDIGGYHTDKEIRKMRKDGKKLDKALCKRMRKGEKHPIFTHCTRLTCIGCRKHIRSID